MSVLTLKSASEAPIDQIVISALILEKKEVLTAILKTKSKLSSFENKYKITTSGFLNKPQDINEMESIEWKGEYETLKRLQAKLKDIEEIKIVHN